MILSYEGVKIKALKNDSQLIQCEIEINFSNNVRHEIRMTALLTMRQPHPQRKLKQRGMYRVSKN